MKEITPDMAGTWLDGHMGWHNTYRVVEIAQEYGFGVNDLDGQAVDAYRNGHETFTTSDGQIIHVADVVHDLTDQATDYLRSLAPEGFDFEWDMGELSLARVALPNLEEIITAQGWSDATVLDLALRFLADNGFLEAFTEDAARTADLENAEA